MRTYTQDDQDHVHYIPANNAFAALLAYGLDGMEEALQTNLAFADNSQQELPLEERFDPVVFKAFRKWYEESYRWCMKEAKNGRQITDKYPPLIVERIQP